MSYCLSLRHGGTALLAALLCASVGAGQQAPP